MKINWFKINKDEIIFYIESIPIYYNVFMISNFLYYLKIGWNCKDCENNYKYCSCSTNYIFDGTFDVFDLARKILSKNDLIKIQNRNENILNFRKLLNEN